MAINTNNEAPKLKEWRGCTGIAKENGTLDLYFADEGKVRSINVWRERL